MSVLILSTVVLIDPADYTNEQKNTSMQLGRLLTMAEIELTDCNQHMEKEIINMGETIDDLKRKITYIQNEFIGRIRELEQEAGNG